VKKFDFDIVHFSVCVQERSLHLVGQHESSVFAKCVTALNKMGKIELQFGKLLLVDETGVFESGERGLPIDYKNCMSAHKKRPNLASDHVVRIIENIDVGCWRRLSRHSNCEP